MYRQSMYKVHLKYLARKQRMIKDEEEWIKNESELT